MDSEIRDAQRAADMDSEDSMKAKIAERMKQRIPLTLEEISSLLNEETVKAISDKVKNEGMSLDRAIFQVLLEKERAPQAPQAPSLPITIIPVLDRILREITRNEDNRDENEYGHFWSQQRRFDPYSPIDWVQQTKKKNLLILNKLNKIFPHF